jgi:hypothetical protein
VESLAPNLHPAVPHVDFSVFNLAIPNIIAYVVLVVLFLLAIWLRLPKILEPAS